MNIPCVDLGRFTRGTPEDKAAFIGKLGRAFEEVGFVAVKNHGIAQPLINQIYEVVQDFFSLPLEKKRGYEIAGLAGQRGYTSFGKEHAKGFDAPDLKEFYQYGQQVEDGEKGVEHYPPNVRVAAVNGFDQAFHEAYRAFEASGTELLRAIARYLGLEESYFDGFVHNGNSILRAIHYPPITQEPKSAVRAEQHEDINLITLLVGASADGLQILTKQGDWLPVTSLPDQIVVNVGDMLQRLTNNRLRSTTHRVVNPPRELWHTSRFSIPFFLHPKSSMRLDEDMTAGEYLDERLREIGLKK